MHRQIHNEPPHSYSQSPPPPLNMNSDDQQSLHENNKQQKTHLERRSSLAKNPTRSQKTFLSSEEKKEDLIHFEQLIRNLIESEHLDHFQEHKKQIFHHLNIFSDQIFLLEEQSLEKLSLLALSGSRNTQSVYADALKCALVPNQQLRKQRDPLVSENKRMFFLEPTGRRLLIHLIEAFWSKSKSNDFCDEALDVISADLFELIRE
jgi:hypothetical protein